MSVPQPNDPNFDQPNPYQPPPTTGRWVPPPRLQSVRPPLVWALLLGLLGGLAYLAFVLVLFRSTGTDRLAGQVFSCNLVLWLVFAIWEMIRHHMVWRSYGVLVIGQGLIMGGMVVTGFGDTSSVVIINLLIMAAAACLAAVSFAISWKYLAGGQAGKPDVRGP